MLAAGRDPTTLDGWVHPTTPPEAADALSLRTENQALRRENERLASRVSELSQELDETSQMVGRLMAEKSEGRAGGSTGSTPALGTLESGAEAAAPDPPWASPGNARAFCQELAATLPEPHGAANVLCCALHPDTDQFTLVASGGADMTVRVSDWSIATTGAAATGAAGAGETLRCPAPPLLLAWEPLAVGAQGGCRLAVGCMDGSLIIAALETGLGEGGQGVFRLIQVGPTLKAHAKYLTGLRWAGGSQLQPPPLLATSSADKTAKLWAVAAGGEGQAGAQGRGAQGAVDGASAEVLRCVKTWCLEEPVEALCFLEPVTSDGGSTVYPGQLCGQLVLSVRGHHCLRYVDLPAFDLPTSVGAAATAAAAVSSVDKGAFSRIAKAMEGAEMRQVPLNHQAWDKHVSFTVLWLEPSPDHRWLLASTDSDRHLVYPRGSNRHARLLTGHAADGFSKPRACWDPSGKFVFSNSQAEGLCKVYVWCVATQRVVARLAQPATAGAHAARSTGGHAGLVRDLHMGGGGSSGGGPFLASASYDRTVKIWRPPTGGEAASSGEASGAS